MQVSVDVPVRLTTVGDRGATCTTQCCLGVEHRAALLRLATEAVDCCLSAGNRSRTRTKGHKASSHCGRMLSGDIVACDQSARHYRAKVAVLRKSHLLVTCPRFFNWRDFIGARATYCRCAIKVEEASLQWSRAGWC